jgi:hypothetical protein
MVLGEIPMSAKNLTGALPPAGGSSLPQAMRRTAALDGHLPLPHGARHRGCRRKWCEVFQQVTSILTNVKAKYCGLAEGFLPCSLLNLLQTERQRALSFLVLKDSYLTAAFGAPDTLPPEHPSCGGTLGVREGRHVRRE